MIGQILSHDRVASTIGSGGRGPVYAAEDTRLGRQVALKVLPPEVAARTKTFLFSEANVGVDDTAWSPSGKWPVVDGNTPTGGDLCLLRNWE